MCNPAAAGLQCLKQTPGMLVCGCPVWVTSTAITDAIRQKFLEAGCSRCVRLTPCPGFACVNPGMGGVCQAVSAAEDPARPIVAPPAGQCMAKF